MQPSEPGTEVSFLICWAWLPVGVPRELLSQKALLWITFRQQAGQRHDGWVRQGNSCRLQTEVRHVPLFRTYFKPCLFNIRTNSRQSMMKMYRTQSAKVLAKSFGQDNFTPQGVCKSFLAICELGLPWISLLNPHFWFEIAVVIFRSPLEDPRPWLLDRIFGPEGMVVV